MIDFLGKHLLDWRLRAVLPKVRGRLLDVGCGTNELARRYNASAGRPLGVGVDVYPWPNVDLVVDDTADLPYDDGSFDTVTVVAALNHIPNREAVLQEIYRVLVPSGLLILTMIPPGISRIWHWFRESADADQAERGMKPGEVYGLRQKDLKRLLDSAGFACKSQSRFMLGVNCLTIAERNAPSNLQPAKPFGE